MSNLVLISPCCSGKLQIVCPSLVFSAKSNASEWVQKAILQEGHQKRLHVGMVSCFSQMVDLAERLTGGKHSSLFVRGVGDGAKTLSISTLSISTISIMTLSIMRLISLCWMTFMLIAIYAECRKQVQYAECLYAECLYAKCLYAECH